MLLVVNNVVVNNKTLAFAIKSDCISSNINHLDRYSPFCLYVYIYYIIFSKLVFCAHYSHKAIVSTESRFIVCSKNRNNFSMISMK